VITARFSQIDLNGQLIVFIKQ